MKINRGHILVGSLWNNYESPSSHREKWMLNISVYDCIKIEEELKIYSRVLIFFIIELGFDWYEY